MDSNSLDAWDYPLGQESIAQQPVQPRDSARLLRIDRISGQIAHHHVTDLPALLPPGAVLVMNDTRVMAARVLGEKPTGGKVELLLVQPTENGQLRGQEVIYKSNKKLRPGTEIRCNEDVCATVTQVLGGGRALVDFSGATTLGQVLDKAGAIPLPPYILGGLEDSSGSDRATYQCVYAARDGAVAAPTAGLHFTNRLLEELSQRGFERTTITLHVGPGTFLPVRASDIRDHTVLPERYEITAATAELLNEAKRNGRPIIAVGTTTTRVLEANYRENSGFSASQGATDLTILPGYEFAAIDGLMTNFHLPKSSLLLLVGALCGRENVLAAYTQAAAAGYRFYSYGDATLML